MVGLLGMERSFSKGYEEIAEDGLIENERYDALEMATAFPDRIAFTNGATGETLSFSQLFSKAGMSEGNPSFRLESVC